MFCRICSYDKLKCYSQFAHAVSLIASMGLKLLFAALLVVELCVLPCVECQRG